MLTNVRQVTAVMTALGISDVQLERPGHGELVMSLTFRVSGACVTSTSGLRPVGDAGLWRRDDDAPEREVYLHFGADGCLDWVGLFLGDGG